MVGSLLAWLMVGSLLVWGLGSWTWFSGKWSRDLPAGRSSSVPSPPHPRSSSVPVVVSPSSPRSVVVHILVCREPSNQLSHSGFSSPFLIPPSSLLTPPSSPRSSRPRRHPLVAMSSHATEIAQLQQAIMHLQAQQQQQVQAAVQAAIAALPQQQAAVPVVVPPVPASAPRVDRPRLAPPSRYAGALGSALDEWERDLLAQFRYYGAAFPDDPSKIVLATSCLQGAAQTWWEADAAHQSINTWPAFITAMRARFRPLESSTQARLQLLSMQQERGVAVTDFINRFQQVMTQIDGMSEADKVIQFERALYRPLANKVFEKKPRTLAEAYEYAVTCDGWFGGLSRFAGQGRVVPHPNSNASSPPGGGTISMDLSNVTSEEQHGPGIDHEEAGSSVVQLSTANSSGNSNGSSQVEALLNALLSRLPPPRSGSGSGRFPSSSSRRRAGGGGKHTSGLSGEVVAARMRAGACIRCGKQGHWKNECPTAGSDSSHNKAKQHQGKE